MNQGKFIVFEGGEGTGKTTQIKMLEEKLRKLKFNVLLTREPGGTNCPIAEKIRQLLKDPENKDMHPKTELFLFLASRAQHVEQIIKRGLQQNKIIICDRFFGSTFAYQHFGRGLFELTDIKNINNFATGGLIPDLTILLDINPQIGIARINDRKNEDRLDSEEMNFHNKVRDGYLKLARSEPNWTVINAEQSIEDIKRQLWDKVQRII